MASFGSILTFALRPPPPLSPNYEATRVVKFLNFEKDDRRSNFCTLKNIYGSKFRSFYLVVIYCFEVFGKLASKMVPHFNTFLKILYKKIKILVLAITFLILYQFSKKLTKILPRSKESFIYMS